jgi:hypothetical protein
LQNAPIDRALHDLHFEKGATQVSTFFHSGTFLYKEKK